MKLLSRSFVFMLEEVIFTQRVSTQKKTRERYINNIPPTETRKIKYGKNGLI